MSAVCGVRIDGVSLQQVLRPDSFSTGTRETVNLQELVLLVTPSCLLAQLLRPHTAADLDVEKQRRRTGHLEGASLVTVDVLVAHQGVVKVEDAVGSLATRIDAGCTLLDEVAVATVNVVRQHTLLVVGNAVVEEQTLRAQHRLRLVLLANIILVALFTVREPAVGLGANVVGGRESYVAVNLCRHCRHEERKDAERGETREVCVTQHAEGNCGFKTMLLSLVVVICVYVRECAIV